MALTLNGTTGLSGIVGSAGTPALQGTDTNTGYFFGTDILGLSTGGSERLRVASDGKISIGIGTARQLLHIHEDSTGACNLVFTNTTTGTAAADGFIIGLGGGGDPNGQIWHQETKAIKFGTSDTERLRIASAGEVLIGRTSKANDINKLVVTGTSPADSYDSQLYLEGSETTGAVNTGGALAFGGHDNTGFRNWANIYGMKENSTGGNTASYMSFHTRANSGNPEEKLRITSTGRLLLGTAVDSLFNGGRNASFQQEGTDAATSALAITRNSNDANPSYISFGKSRGTSAGANTAVQNGDVIGTIEFNAGDGSGAFNAHALIKGSVDAAPGNSDAPGRLSFWTTPDGGSTTPTERLRIGSDGNVEIVDGDLVISTAGHGIDFSASGGPQGSGSEILDDYEEGTFTPTVTASSSTGTVSYINQYGFYTKVGNMVNLWIMLNFTESGSSGDLQIESLPFGNSSTTGSYAVGAFQCNDMEDSYQSNVGQYTTYIAPSATKITLRGTKTNGSGFESMAIQGMSYMRIQHTYRAN